MNFHQTPEEIIKNATAEQRILWNYIFLRFGEKIGVSQLYYFGLVIGSEFLLYSINKLYVGLSVSFSGIGPAGVAAATYLLYDAANVVTHGVTNNIPVWDATAAALKYNQNSYHIKNILFSRMVCSSNLVFIGYRLSI